MHTVQTSKYTTSSPAAAKPTKDQKVLKYTYCQRPSSNNPSTLKPNSQVQYSLLGLVIVSIIGQKKRLKNHPCANQYQGHQKSQQKGAVLLVEASHF